MANPVTKDGSAAMTDLITPVANHSNGADSTNVKDTAITNEKLVVALDEPFKNVQPSGPTLSTTTKLTPSAFSTTGTESNMVTPLERLGEEPTWIDCPYCEERTKTEILQSDSSQTTLAAFLCCLFCGIVTVCIPTLCHMCANVEHKCSKCKRSVAFKPYEGQTQARYPHDTMTRPSQYPLNKPSQYVALPADKKSIMQARPGESESPVRAPSQPVQSSLLVKPPPAVQSPPSLK